MRHSDLLCQLLPVCSCTQVFEDEESRAFYESLVDVRAVVPAVLLGDKGKEGGSQQEGGAAAGSDAASSEAAGAGGEAGGKKELPGSASSASLGGSKQELSYEDILEVGNTGHIKLAAVATCSWTFLPCWMCVQHACSLVTQPSCLPRCPAAGQGCWWSGGCRGGGPGAVPARPAAGPPAGLCEQGAGGRAGCQLLLRAGGHVRVEGCCRSAGVDPALWQDTWLAVWPQEQKTKRTCSLGPRPSTRHANHSLALPTEQGRAQAAGARADCRDAGGGAGPAAFLCAHCGHTGAGLPGCVCG